MRTSIAPADYRRQAAAALDASAPNQLAATERGSLTAAVLFRVAEAKLFAGEKAEHIVRAAEDMANVLYSKVNDVPDPRFDPANLTDEQRARYTSYKASAGSDEP